MLLMIYQLEELIELDEESMGAIAYPYEIYKFSKNEFPPS